MNKQMHNDRPVLLLTAAQGMLLGAMAVIAGAWAISLCYALRELVAVKFVFSTEIIVNLVCGAGVALCGLTVMWQMLGVCGRVKRETAFTRRNVRALGIVGLAFAVASALLLPVGGALMNLVLWGTFAEVSEVWGLLPSFICVMAALLMQAIRLLLRRAVTMQDESDLTV